jgi:prolyl oligopeptidase
MRFIQSALVVSTLLPATFAAPPATERKPVTDTYHSESVVDDYRWLEDGKSKEVQQWSDAQNAYARAYLDKLSGRDKIRDRVKELLAARTTTHANLQWRSGKLFAMKRQPPKEQPFLVVMPSPQEPDKARVLVDPTVLDAKGTTSIDWYQASPDGKLVAVSTSKVGSESGDLHVYDTETGKQVDAVIPRVQNGTAGGDLAWAPDSQGFYYTRYPRAKERPAEDMDFYQQVYFHRLGTSADDDRYELGKDFPRIAECRLFMHNPSGKLLVSVQNGDGGEFAHYVRTPDGKYKQFADFKDKAVQALFAPDGKVLVVSRHRWPRGEVLRLGDDLDLKTAEPLVSGTAATIVTNFYEKPTLVTTESALYVTYQHGGPSDVRAFGFSGKSLPKPKQPPVAAVAELTPMGDHLLIGLQSFVEPFAQYLVDKKFQVVKTTLTTDPPVDFKDIEVRREFATSKDGTKVPVNILIPKRAKLDGSDPFLVTGYGGYGINTVPEFKADRRVLFDHGVILAVANIRGGGEYGEEWHDNGRMTKKQNVFDDFAAVLEYLIDKKYTSPQKLAIEGGSNGGLLMGAMMTQHPDLMKCVISHVGIYDMLRVELSPNGAFNVPEFGTVKDPEQYKALKAYSPYHNVKDGVKLPATLFLTGANDPRVDPMQSRKMTARVQYASPNSLVLLRTSGTSGHGHGTALSERIEQQTDVVSFLFAQLGVTP